MEIVFFWVEFFQKSSNRSIGRDIPMKNVIFVLIGSKSAFPGYPARGVFYFAPETSGKCIVRLVVNDV
jgi:hypothetical protein